MNNCDWQQVRIPAHTMYAGRHFKCEFLTICYKLNATIKLVKAWENNNNNIMTNLI